MSDNTSPEAIKRDFPGKSQPGRSPVGVILLVLLAIAAGLGYWLWQQSSTLAEIKGEYAALESRSNAISSLQQSQEELQRTRKQQQEQLQQLNESGLQLQGAQQQLQSNVQQQVQVALNSLNEQSTRLNKLGEDIASLRNRVADLGSGAVRVQVIAEALGLLRLADQRLQVAQDVETAIVLTGNADELLSKLNDAAVGTVRSQLARDANALDVARQQDGRALYQQLSEAISKLGSLSAVSKTAVQSTTLQTQPSTEASAGWFSRLLSFIGQYFVITQRDAVITPLLSPEQSWLVRKSVELQLQQARLAALQCDAQVYRSALQDAETAVREALQGDNKEALLKQLKLLQELPPRNAIPSLTASITALQQLQTRAGTTQ